ncbi:MAG TPA: hypothetical protein VF546_07490 [Pyrinomonadaceae bacterium]|jgi:hypothetical protein
MYSCRQFRAELEEGARRAPVTAQAAAHAAGCAACRAFGAERQALGRLLGELEPVGAPADFEFRLRARLAAREGAGVSPLARFAQRARLSLAPRLLATGLAACLVLACAAALGWRTLHTSPPQSTASHPATSATANDPISVATTQQGATAARQETASHGGALATTDTATTHAPVSVRHASRGATRVAASSAVAKVSSSVRERGVGVARHTAQPVPENVPGVSEAAVRGAQPLVAHLGNSAIQPAPIPLPVAASAKPLRVLLRDPRGAAREVSLEPVSFGARDLLAGRTTVQRVNASYTQGVW